MLVIQTLKLFINMCMCAHSNVRVHVRVCVCVCALFFRERGVRLKSFCYQNIILVFLLAYKQYFFGANIIDKETGVVCVCAILWGCVCVCVHACPTYGIYMMKRQFHVLFTIISIQHTFPAITFAETCIRI